MFHEKDFQKNFPQIKEKFFQLKLRRNKLVNGRKNIEDEELWRLRHSFKTRPQKGENFSNKRFW